MIGTDVFDGLVWLGAHRADRAAQPVRLVRFTRGRHDLHLPHQRARSTRVSPGGDRRGVRAALGHRTGLQAHQTALGLAPAVGGAAHPGAASRCGRCSSSARCSKLSAWKSPAAPAWTRMRSRWRCWSSMRRSSPTKGTIRSPSSSPPGGNMGSFGPPAACAAPRPTIPLDQLCPLPPDLVLTRSPRHAQRKCDIPPRICPAN